MILGHEAYLESDIYAADPIELVRLLYESAVDALREARRKLAARDIRGRAAQINRALSLVTELSLSVNRAAAPEIGSNLIELYDYIQRLLIDASVRQVPEPLEEAERLLAVLAEAWAEIAVPPVSAAPGGYTPLHCSF